MMAPDYCLESFQVMVHGEESRSLSLGDTGWDLVRPRCLEFTGENTREEGPSKRQSSKLLQIVPLTLQLSTDCECIQGNYLMSEKYPTERIREKNPQSSHSLGVISVSTDQSKTTTNKQIKPLITHGALWRGFRRVLPQYLGKINPRLIGLHLTKLKNKTQKDQAVFK